LRQVGVLKALALEMKKHFSVYALSISLAMHISFVAVAAGGQMAQPRPPKAQPFTVRLLPSGGTLLDTFAAAQPVPQEATSGANHQNADGTGAFPSLVPVGVGDLVMPSPQKVYLSSSEVDVRPRSLAQVVVPFPDAPLGTDHASAVLLLYINEDGAVDRVDVQESGLPKAFEQISVETFMKARMQPAMKDGKKTPAKMKIMVEFDAR
jgi:TonB family protein